MLQGQALRLGRSRIALVPVALAAVIAAGAVVMMVWLHPAWGPGSSRPSPEALGPETGRQAPAFAVPGLSGGHLALSQYAGRPRILTFFAAWCESCWNDMAVLQHAHDRYRSRGLVILGVGVQDTAGDLRLMAGKLGVRFPLGYDQNGDLAARPYHVYSIPTTVFISADGTIKTVVQGRVHTDTLQQFLPLILPAAAQ